MRLILPLLLLTAAVPLAAQVGHAPAQSPYRDISHGMSLTLLGGDIGGSGGAAGFGPHNGPSYGIRYDIRVGGPVQFSFAVAKADLERSVAAINDSLVSELDGPVKQSVTMIEVGLQFNITGRKSWHRLAPFLDASIGLVNGASLPASVDSTGYNFGNKIYLAPALGVQVFLSKSLHVRLEARELFWELKYPLTYDILTKSGGKEWASSTELRAGLGVSF